MGIDVLNVGRRKGGILQSPQHDARHSSAILGGRRNVVRVARHSVSRQLTVDPRASGNGPLALFEHQDSRPFSHHETVAIQVPRPRGALGFVVSRRERAHGGETADRQSRDEDVFRLGEGSIVEGREDDADEGRFERGGHAGKRDRLADRLADDGLGLRRVHGDQLAAIIPGQLVGGGLDDLVLLIPVFSKVGLFALPAIEA